MTYAVDKVDLKPFCVLTCWITRKASSLLHVVADLHGLWRSLKEGGDGDYVDMNTSSCGQGLYIVFLRVCYEKDSILVIG